MKNLLSCAALSAAFLFNACNNAATTTETATNDSTMTSSAMATPEPTQAEKNTANMKAIYNGIETGDMSASNAFFADDVVDHDAGRNRELKGKDSIQKMLGDIHNHVADMKFEIISDATGGEYHFALTKISGKTKDGSMGMPANMNFTDTSIDMVRVSNGKVMEHWSFHRPGNLPQQHKMGK
ncbi:MAG: nuclear transport factor 2 family protein [Flavitalea sp.]